MWFLGADKWPPPAWVWAVAALVSFVVTPILILIGGLGKVLLGLIVVCFLALGARARVRTLGAEEFWKSRPKD